MRIKPACRPANEAKKTNTWNLNIFWLLNEWNWMMLTQISSFMIPANTSFLHKVSKDLWTWRHRYLRRCFTFEISWVITNTIFICCKYYIKWRMLCRIIRVSSVLVSAMLRLRLPMKTADCLSETSPVEGWASISNEFRTPESWIL